MENLRLSFQVVLPLFLMLALGYGVRCLKLMDDKSLRMANNLVFRVFLPIMLFMNIYNARGKVVFRPALALFAMGCVLATFLLAFLLIPRLENENARRGVLIQGIFRSNFILFGVPLTVSLLGEGNEGMTSLLIAVVIPLYNVLAVVILEYYRGGRPDGGKILKGIVTNPLIIASLLAILFLLTGLRFPAVIEKTAGDLGGVATPLALVILGASFRFEKVRGYARQLLLGVAGRLVVVPLLFLPLAVLLGFRGAELTALLAMLASPAAIASFTMTQQLGGDDELAGQLLVFSSAFSMVTIFLWVLVLKQLCLL